MNRTALALLVALALILPVAAWAQAGGVAGGSSVGGYLFQHYDTDAANAAAKTLIPTLRVVSGVMFGVSCILVTLMAKQAMFGSLSASQLATYLIRIAIVGFLLVPANFSANITQRLTVDIPNQIAATANGGNTNQTVSEAFDGLENQITNFVAKATAQATGANILSDLAYIPARLEIGLGGLVAKIFVILTELIWAVVMAVIPFLLPLVAVLLPFAIFEATNQWSMRIASVLLSLYVLLFIVLQLAVFIAKIDGDYMLSFANLITATPPTQSFQANAGDGLFSAQGFAAAEAGIIPDPAQPLPGGGGSAVSANIEAGIVTLFNLVLVTCFGFFILSFACALALFLGGSHGFSLGPITNAVSAGVMKGLQRLGRLRK